MNNSRKYFFIDAEGTVHWVSDDHMCDTATISISLYSPPIVCTLDNDGFVMGEYTLHTTPSMDTLVTIFSQTLER